MDGANAWKELFTTWPEALPRRGVIIVSFDEQIAFQEFMVRDDLLLVQRRTPDTIGAREVIVPFGEIVGMKMVDVVKPSVYQKAGFEAKPAT